jgi:riboflavin synthase
MFTGLVEGMGIVRRLVPEEPGLRLVIEAPEALKSAPVALGDSIALNGCCLTVVAFAEGHWEFQAGPETLAKTNLGRLQVGHVVNVERPLAADGRLGGHFVQGHVDGTGEVDQILYDGASRSGWRWRWSPRDR